MADSTNLFVGSKVLITGGMGFIGSNLARRLIEQGAEVVLVDNLIPEYGGNLFNMDGVEGKFRLNIADVRDEHTITEAIVTWARDHRPSPPRPVHSE